jgi:hypothetical protein
MTLKNLVLQVAESRHRLVEESFTGVMHGPQHFFRFSPYFCCGFSSAK